MNIFSKHTYFSRKLFDYSARAYSIVESISALLIVTISFGAGISIYSFINKDAIEDSNTKLLLQLNNLLANTKESKSYWDETLQTDNIKIERRVEPYGYYNRLLKISIVAVSVTDDHEIQRISEVINK